MKINTPSSNSNLYKFYLEHRIKKNIKKLEYFEDRIGIDLTKKYGNSLDSYNKGCDLSLFRNKYKFIVLKLLIVLFKLTELDAYKTEEIGIKKIKFKSNISEIVKLMKKKNTNVHLEFNFSIDNSSTLKVDETYTQFVSRINKNKKYKHLLEEFIKLEDEESLKILSKKYNKDFKL